MLLKLHLNRILFAAVINWNLCCTIAASAPKPRNYLPERPRNRMQGFCRPRGKKNTEGKPQHAVKLGTIIDHYLLVCPSQSHPCMNMWPLPLTVSTGPLVFRWQRSVRCGGSGGETLRSFGKAASRRRARQSAPSFLQGRVGGIMRLKTGKNCGRGTSRVTKHLLSETCAAGEN